MTPTPSPRSLTLADDVLKDHLDVVRGSDALGLEEASAVLHRMIPEEIQQFFLFDAEALNRYEDLLHDPTAGDELKTAIERILGVPVLKNAVEDLKALTAKHTKLIAKLDTEDTKAKQAADSLAQLNAIIEKSADDIEQIKEAITVAENDKGDIEKQMEASVKARALLAAHHQAVEAHDAAKDAHRQALEGFQAAAPHVWPAVLTPTLTAKINDLRSEIATYEDQQRSFQRERLLAEFRAEIADVGTCPCCGQSADAAHIESDTAAIDHTQALSRLKTRLDALERVCNPGAVVLVTERDSVLQAAAMRVHDTKSDLTEAAEEIEGIDDPDLSDLPLRLSNAKLQLRNLRSNLHDAEKAHSDHRQQAANLAAIVAEHGGKEGAAATQKQKLLADLQTMFSSAINNYRTELKDRVETEATEVFLSMRSETDFVGLSINDDYGLSILHADGEVEPHRSAGYEHIVALSLVAALQRCAPVQGPIFMDMPFARLDPNHTLQTLKALPAVADQVVLIVHEGEINHKEATRALGSTLVTERQLVRRSARHTDIMKLGEI